MQDSMIPVLGIANYRQEPSDAEQEIIRQKMEKFLRPYKILLPTKYVNGINIKWDIETYDFKELIIRMSGYKEKDDKDFQLEIESFSKNGKFEGFKMDSNFIANPNFLQELFFVFINKLKEIEAIYDRNNS